MIQACVAQESKKTEKTNTEGVYLTIGQLKSRLALDYPDKCLEELDELLLALVRDRTESGSGVVEDLNCAGSKKFWYADRQKTEARLYFIKASCSACSACSWSSWFSRDTLNSRKLFIYSSRIFIWQKTAGNFYSPLSCTSPG